MPSEQRFAFRFTTGHRRAARSFGITPQRAWLTLGDDLVSVRYGPWRVRTPLSNIASASITGPYAVLKTIGPPHLGLTDRGLTFASNHDAGVECLFRLPIAGIEPFGLFTHPNLTLTVADPTALLAALRARGVDVT